MQYLLDTSICIAAMRKHAQVIARMQSLTPGDLAISTVTSFELFTGVEKCARPAVERAKVEALIQAITELPLDAQAARASARIRAQLEALGASIGPYDLLIAGQAIGRGLVLATSNSGEFIRVPNLRIEDWKVAAPNP
jgi:tRNA(fMet)-specific endonuclease VapC